MIDISVNSDVVCCWWPGTSLFFVTQRAIDGPYIYFVTTNATYRARIFDSVQTAKILGAIITATCQEFDFTLYGYCILPDHIHLLVEKNGAANLSVLMKHIKGRFWNLHSGGAGKRVWQPRFNFRIIDNEERYSATVEYVQNNFFKGALDDRYDEYPYTVINWRAIQRRLE